MLKFLLLTFLFVTAVFAQGIVIGLPTANQSVVAGSNLTVQIQLPDTLSESDPIAVAIGLQSCPNNPCNPPTGDMGIVLYTGLFQPQRHEPYLPPYENFTVEVDSSTPAGAGLLGVAYFSLVGAGPSPSLVVLNQTLTIVS